MKKLFDRKWLTLVSGVTGIALGITMIIRPESVSSTLIIVLGTSYMLEGARNLVPN